MNTKKYTASFPNGYKFEISEEYAKKILWLQRVIREQRSRSIKGSCVGGQTQLEKENKNIYYKNTVKEDGENDRK